MPFFGIGLHVLIALYFAIHAVRHGQPLYWLVILFMFPLLGSAVYFFAVYLPNSKLERTAHRALNAAAKVLDPSKALREAQAAFEYTPTAQNQMRLAEALFNAGDAKQAATHFEACLQGPFANDLNIKLGAAKAYIACGQLEHALTQLTQMRALDEQFRAEQISILMATVLAGLSRDDEAQQEFEGALTRYGSFEIKVEYAIWAQQRNKSAIAAPLLQDIDRTMERWNGHTRELNRELVKRLNQNK